MQWAGWSSLATNSTEYILVHIIGQQFYNILSKMSSLLNVMITSWNHHDKRIQISTNIHSVGLENLCEMNFGNWRSLKKKQQHLVW